MVKVDQMTVPEDSQRRVICLTPTTWYPSVFNGLFGEPQTLKRRRITYGEANVLTYTSTKKEKSMCMVSLGVNGSPSSVSIKYQTLIGLCLRLQQAKHPNVSDVEKYLRNDGVEEAPILAPIIYAAWEGGWYRVDYKVVNKQVACGKVSKAPHYQVLGPLLTEIGEPIGEQVWKPVVTGAAVFPRRSYNNDTQAVVGRIDNVRNTTKPKGAYVKYMREFVRAFPAAKLDPLSISEVIEIQNRPTQRARSEQAKPWVGNSELTVKAFMKKESYQKISDPRNISTCTTSHTLNLSTYTYQAKKIFQTYDWFVPGLKPAEIVNAVQEFVLDTDSIMSTDYSRLDGTISAFLRKVERGVYLRLFHSRYAKELGELLDAEVKCKATTATGKAYDPGFSRLSGSPLTTDGNTIIVAFVLYCAARKAGYIEEGEIHRIPGLVYGDDQMAKHVPEELLVAVATDLGLGLKVETARIGQPFTYLSRVFIDAWSTKTTIQSPLRALSKMHLSCVRNVDPRIVARYKAEGYYVTDRCTPLISDYCLRIIADTSDVTELHLANPQLKRDANWWLTEFGSDASWPQDESDRDAMEFIVAKDLALEVTELRNLCERVRDGDWTPLEKQLPVTVPAVVTSGGDSTVVEPPKQARRTST
nr:MAG: RNA-dependent RNA polymerase [Riboviria sp.]